MTNKKGRNDPIDDPEGPADFSSSPPGWDASSILTKEITMPRPLDPGSPGPTEGPTAGRTGPVAVHGPGPDPGPVLGFARELGRLLGVHLARVGFPAVALPDPEPLSSRSRRRRDPRPPRRRRP